MSRHHFKVLRGEECLVVVLGYDRPTRSYFMTVEDSQSKVEKMLYASDEDPTLSATWGEAKDLERYKEVLRELGISVPQAMLDGVMGDGASNAGNRIVAYDEAGAPTVLFDGK